ncbi:centrosomal protein of 170 kDa protein B [Corythoichthys intestinalis]|uniref:centrosomal protein of 170 kDa protein B n=1 Tax=Corythoichthys intestinalis TaxID=161448 RepID=UPI0025A66874|nr:centrosomal protein of 170 kDa protein B-like [Corythoichthys intestinalis]
MSVTSWFLVSGSGTRHRLPKEMIFVGREDCELMLQSRSVDKQHAVINYNATTDQHLVKDLGSLNGTFVNDLRIPDQTYMTLKVSDILRFGYDSHVYVLEKSQHKVPEEALKHEKYTSQLQISLKPSQTKKDELEKNTVNKITIQDVPVPRPTPLYGQPSWWGEEDCGSRTAGRDEPQKEEPRTEAQKESDTDFPECLSGPRNKSVFPAYRREADYFEIPTKDSRLPEAVEAELQEIPTKDTPPTPGETPPAIQSHASFTIEFDECAPGKIKIKDHVTKFSSRHGKTAPPVKAAPAMSSQSKVADWLVRGDLGVMRMRPVCDDVYSTKSDLAINVKSSKGHHHDDGTQSDSEDPTLKSGRSKSRRPEATSPAAPEPEPCRSPPRAPSPVADPSPERVPSERLSQRAFVIEFFDDNPRKKRSQSFTHNPAHADSYSALKTKPRRGGERPASVHGHVAPTQQVTVPLKGPGGGGAPQRSASLKREHADAETSRSTSAISVRPYGSVGKESKLAREFAVEFLKDSSPDSLPTRERMSSPPASAPPVMVRPPPSPPQPSTPPVTAPPALPPLSFPGGEPEGRQKPSRNEEDDSVSEAGTYTIDTEAHDREVEDARNMIDQVFGVLDSPEYGGQSPGTPRPVIDEGRDERADVASCCAMLHDFSLASGGVPATSSIQPPGPEGPKWVSRWASLADSCGATPTQEDSQVPVRPSEGHGHDLSESESGHGSRTRRLLPQVPPEKPDGALLVCREDRSDGAPPRRRESARCLTVQDELEPDSLSDASRSEDGPVLKNRRAALKTLAPSEGPEKLSSSCKSAIFYIGSEENPTKADSSRPEFRAKTPPTAVLIRQLGAREPRKGGIKANSSAPDLRTSRDKDASSLIRRESFTKAGPSDNVRVEKLPQISAERAPGYPAPGAEKGGHVDDSLSGESDVDTASTVSQVSGKNASVAKKGPDGALRKDESPSARQKGRQPSARERLSEKRRKRTPADERVQTRRGVGRASMDASSESRSGKKPGSRLQKEERVKTAEAQVLTRSNSLSAPRPTRASMLRRARLGEASDNEGAETDRASQSSDHAAASKETKKLSRLDILALPRRRTGSLAASGDDATSSASRGAFPDRKKSSADEARAAASRAAGKNALSRAKYPNSGIHPKRKNSNFSSSSDEDYKSDVAKAKRSAGTLRSDGTPAGRSKSVSAETEEDDDRSDPYQNWSTHSAEIAKLSHDLAKDLAILAREIHDVAGDGDCPAADAAPGSAPDTSASAMSASEEDTQLLSPLRHLSHAIRDNTEQLAAKLKMLFHNKAEAWEEIDKKIKTDTQPTGTSNKEITSIVAELRRVQKQLEVINRVVDPAGNPQAPAPGLRTSSKEKKQNGVSPKTRRHVP